MFNSPTTSRCDHKSLYRKLGFGLMLFQRQSLPPLPFFFSETFTFFCVYVTDSSSHVLCILITTTISSRPPHHMQMPLSLPPPFAATSLVLELCPRCDSLVTYCKARSVQWATGNVLVLPGHAGTMAGDTIWGPGAQSCGLFWNKQVVLSNYSFSSEAILIHTSGLFICFLISSVA